MRPFLWSFSSMTDVLIGRGNLDADRHREEVAICKPRREASEETNPANTVTSDSSPQDCEKYISIIYVNLWHFTVAALVN